MLSTSFGPGRLFSQPLQQYWHKYTVHNGKRVKQTAPLPRQSPELRWGWLHQHLGVPQGYQHRPVSEFLSHHSAAHKRTIVKTLMCKAEALSSSGVSQTQEKKHLTQALKRNGYPMRYIHKHTCMFTAWLAHGCPCANMRHVCHWPLSTSMDCLIESIRRVLAIQVTFRTLYMTGASASEGPNPGKLQKGSGVQHPMCRMPELVHGIIAWHIIVLLPYCIYTSVPVSVNDSLMKATVGCRNDWASFFSVLTS